MTRPINKKTRVRGYAISYVLFAIGTFLFILSFNLLYPFQKEQYVGDSMLIWEGEMTRCGLDDKVDALSMYCRGYKEGYEWGGEQATMYMSP